MKDTQNPGRTTPATPQLSARGDAITMAISLTVNGTTRSVEAEPDTPLLYVLRNDFELNGPKFGCGRLQCGACAVLINGAAVRSCMMPIANLSPNEITTLEGLGTLDKLHPLQKAFIDEQAVQCGYCARHDHCGGRPAQAQSAADRSRGSQRSPTICVAAAATTASSAPSCG
jgi:[2Fe-2S] binding domain